jgi:DNA primase
LTENFVDFRMVKERVSVESALNHYGVRLRRVNPTTLRGRCPLPTHESKTSKESFGVQTAKNIWACQSSSCAASRDGKRGGNVLDFVSLMEHCSIREAALKLQEWFSISAPTAPEDREAQRDPEKEKLVAKEKEGSGEAQENKPLAFSLKGVDPTHPYLRQRGIKEETAKHFGVGFFPGRGSMSGRVVIPIENERGELVAYAGRSIDGTEPKYKVPTGFVKGAVLFNFHRVSGEEVIVVEGFFDSLKVWQSGNVNVVGLMGCSLSVEQQELLARFKKIVLLLDGDDAGRRATDEIAARLVHSHFVRAINLDAGRQPDQLSSEELRNLLRF